VSDAGSPDTVLRQKRRGLGRGLDALLTAAGADADEGSILVNLDPNGIGPNPEQPRRNFDEQALEGLAESIRMHGLLHPIVVERTPHGYRLVAGARRLMAAQRAGLTTVPAIVRPAAESARHALELALTENIHRTDLDPMEEASAYARLADTFGLSHDAIAMRLGRARPTISNSIRLLGLSPPLQEAVSEGRIIPSHARALVAIPDHAEQEKLAADLLARGGMNSNVFESLVQDRLTELRGGVQKRRPARPLGSALSADDEALRRSFERALGTAVALRRRLRGGGELVISFSSDEDLGAIYERIGGLPL